METFVNLREELKDLIVLWEARLLDLNPEVITEKRNNQNRTIKQIVGHMVDSASRNPMLVAAEHDDPDSCAHGRDDVEGPQRVAPAAPGIGPGANA